MGQIENMWQQSFGRRKALLGLAGALAGSPLLGAQQDPPMAGGLLKDHTRALGIDEVMTSFEFEPIFKANVPLPLFDYVAHASDSEWTLLRNREAYGWVEIVSRTAVDVSAVSLSTELFGLKLDSPLFISPSGRQFLTHPQGTPAMRKGANDAKTLMVIPGGVGGDGANTDKAWDDTMKAGTYPFFWQFYPNKDLKTSRATLEKMQTAGARAITITFDQQSAFYPRSAQDHYLREDLNDVRDAPTVMNKDTTPMSRDSQARWWYTWKYVDQIREFIKVPMVAKGIITPEDAELCIQHGLDGILVSNHGGRSLCYEPSSIEALPEILAAVHGRIPVLFDSGVRRGSDAFKALAMGANAVGLGRASRWALGAFGAPGVTKLFEIMNKELAVTMAKAGRPTVASLDPSAIKTHFV